MEKDGGRKAYGGFSLFGVPYSGVDIRFAAEALYESYTMNGRDDGEAIQLILNNNERVVTRCGMLISFSGVLMAILLFIANKPSMLPALWQQYVYCVIMAVWMSSTMILLWSLRHRLPPPWEFDSRYDFAMTAELYITRMGWYNLTLIATILSFIVIVFVLSPISTVISDRLFSGPPLQAP